MAKSKNPRSSSYGRGTGRFGSFLLGIVVAGAIAAGAWWYLRPQSKVKRNPPGVQANPHSVQAKPASLAEPRPGANAALPIPISPIPASPIPDQALPDPPFGISEVVFESGAQLYAQKCAFCHGIPGRRAAGLTAGVRSIVPSQPAPAQFWDKPYRGRTSLDARLFFVRTKFGVPGQPAMPAYQGKLTDAQMWDVALLLQRAGEELPRPVLELLQHAPLPK